jgi:hypothetical protein
MRRLGLRQFVSVLALAGAFLVGFATLSAANPPGIPDGWHKVYQFNMIGFPADQEYTGGCGQGNRVFVNRDAHNATMLVTDGPSWDIIDCNATADNRAEMTRPTSLSMLFREDLVGLTVTYDLRDTYGDTWR